MLLEDKSINGDAGGTVSGKIQSEDDILGESFFPVSETEDAAEEFSPEHHVPGKALCRNGYIKYYFNESGVFISVVPPQGGGKRVPADELKKELLKHGFKHLTREGFLVALYQAHGKPVKLSGPLFDVEKKDGHFTIEVVKGGTESLLFVSPPWGGKPVTFEQVMFALERKGIVFGVDEDAVRAALEEMHEDSGTVVARGAPPVQGKDAVIRYYFEKDVKTVPRELENGRVDYHDLNTVMNARTGTLLAEKIPATEGAPGKSVFGNEIPAKRGKDAALPYGKGVERSEDGLRLYASEDGCPVIAGNQLKVLTVYEVKGDVDFSTGNIYFVGDVVVHGTVKPGFKIIASGNVEVDQCVEDACIESEGKVVIRRGISGHGKAYIKAASDVLAKFIEHAEVYTNASVHTEECMHSTVYAGEKVVVDGKQGRIVGGLTRARQEVSAKTVGSPLATPTEIEVGIEPKLKDNLLRVSSQIASDTENLNRVDKGIQYIEKFMQSGESLPAEKAALYEKLSRTKRQIEERLEDIKEKRRKLKEQIFAEPEGNIIVKELLYPGVKVSFKRATRLITEEKKNVCLYEKEGEVKEMAYREGIPTDKNKMYIVNGKWMV